MSSSYITYAIIAVVIFTAYMAIMHIFRTDRVQKRVRNAADVNYLSHEEDNNEISLLARFCESALVVVGVKIKEQKELMILLSQAGINSPHAATYFLFFKKFLQPIFLVLGIIFFLKVLVFSAGATKSIVLLNLIISLLFLVIGLFGANLYVTNRKQKRQQILLYSFPEMLDLLLVCIESGLGLDAALNRVSHELRTTHPVISWELDRTRFELTMLNDRVHALQNLAERTEIVPFKSLIASLIQTEKFGTSLVDMLRVLSDEQRTTRLFTAEQRAARIPVLITIPLILCILPAFIMIILGPPIVRVINQGGIFGPSTK